MPVRDDRTLFEFLILEGAQAGLSWSTILNKREGYRRLYDGFDPKMVAGYDEAKVAELLTDPAIVRNRAKVAASIGNAQAFLEVQAEFGSFSDYIWRFTDGRPIQNRLDDACPRFRRRRPSPRPSPRISRSVVSSLSARPSSTPTCRRRGWSTITS